MPISVIGHASGQAITSVGINTAGASLLVVGVVSYSDSSGGFGDTVVIDTYGNTWTPLDWFDEYGGRNQSFGDTCYVRFFYCNAPTTGAAHFFQTNAVSLFGPQTVFAIALSGTKATSPLDLQDGNGSPSNNTSMASNSLTPSENNCIVLTLLGNSITGNGAHDQMIDSGFTVVEQVHQFNYSAPGGGLAYKIQTSSGTETPTWSWTSNCPKTVVIASFKAAAVAGSNSNFFF